MKGILLISHGEMAKGMFDSISLFFGDLNQVDYLCLKKEDNPDVFRSEMEKKINKLNSGDGVVVLADIMGGTPCNQSAYLIHKDVTVLTGMNLGMLMTLMTVREMDSLDIEHILEESKQGVLCLNDLLGVMK